MAERIALFADRDSKQCAEIAAAVADAGAEPVMCDIQLGGSGRVTMTAGAGRFAWNGIDFSDIRAVHVRCTAPRTLPALPPVLNAATHAEYRAQFIREQEFNAATYAFLELLAASGRLVANTLTTAYVDHSSKPQLYEKLRAWGFRAPRSLTTNDPAAARRFLAEVGEAVVKPAIGIGSTRLVSEADAQRLDELVTCPALFQERAVGDVIRVHVLGDKVVLALFVETDTIDSRTAPKGFRWIELDPAEEAKIVAASRRLGLHYAGWDAIQAPEGHLTYLDCNPGPNLMWIDPRFRRIVFDQLARFLITYSRTGSVDEADGVVTPWRPN